MLSPACVVPFCLVASVLAQTPQWRLLTATNPLPLTGHEVAYDHRRDQVVLFGGMTGHLPMAYLAEFDGSAWVPRTAVGPAPRVGHKLAYDGKRAETLLVGGAIMGPTFFTDTWVWNGNAWIQRFPATSPPALFSGFTLTYDEHREVVVLYAGQSLYEWDGTNWIRRTPVGFPAWRRYHAAAYDSRRKRLLIHGGQVQNSTTLAHLDTWSWDGVTWQQVATNGPAGVLPQMVYDRERDVALAVMSGGASYEFDGSTWSLAPTVSGFGLLAYDRQRNRAVYTIPWHSGPSGPTPGATYVYEVPGLAVAQPYGTACGSPALVARADSNARPVIGTTLGTIIENVPSGAAFMCFGWSADQVLGLALPRPMDAWGLPGCWLLQSDDAITLPCTMTGPGTARFDFALPNAAGFVGLPFFLQPWAPAPGLNPAGAAIGNGVAVTIGAF